GFGTLEEFLEATTWAQLGIHSKPVGLLNVDGYYNCLLSFIDQAVEEGFVPLYDRPIIVSAPTAKELVEKLEEYVPCHEGIASQLNWEMEQLGYPQQAASSSSPSSVFKVLYPRFVKSLSLTKGLLHATVEPSTSPPSLCKSKSKFSPKPPQSLSPKTLLLDLISDQDRGLKSQQDPQSRTRIIEAIEALAVHGRDSVTTDSSSLSGTWRMRWTTEKEQLYIIKNAYLLGTKVGDVLQVIDVDNLLLSNVITFPPSGVFLVRSEIEVASNQRVNFRFTSAVLRGKGWEVPLPPFGQGWFESVYLDDDIRLAKDIRGDYLVVDRPSYEWKE
ncbi:hypothetical protein Dimus_034633, partial [Dionaea muscipula]